MKVLWFANTPCGATEYLTGNKVTGGGWLYALSEALSSHSEIELHIAFYWHCELDSFIYEGITYHPIFREGLDSKLGRYLYRLKQQYSSNVDVSEIDRIEDVVKVSMPDLIHFHGSEENFGLVAERIDNIPMLLSIQGLISPYYYKLYSGYDRTKIFRYQSFMAKIFKDGFGAQEKCMYKRSIRERKMLKLIDNIIGRTAWDRDCSLALSPHRTYFVCNEILRKPFFQTQWKKKNIDGKIVFVSTISFGIYKGLEVIYHTSKILKEQNVDFEWYVVGISLTDQMAKVTKCITGINPVSVNIHLVGRKNANEIIDIFNKSHIFIQTSHIENSPNSLCEAMLVGMPIIASFAGGTNSMLENGKEGILIQDGDPYRLAGAILYMFQNYDKAVEMGQVARSRATVRHNPDNVVNELLGIYRVLCRK